MLSTAIVLSLVAGVLGIGTEAQGAACVTCGETFDECYEEAGSEPDADAETARAHALAFPEHHLVETRTVNPDPPETHTTDDPPDLPPAADDDDTPEPEDVGAE